MVKIKTAILGLSLFMTACGQQRDAEIRNRLSGTWHCVQVASSHTASQSVFTIAPDGEFTNDVIRADGTLAAEISGTFQVSDRYLVATVTTDSRKGRGLPYIQRAKLIRVDDREMTIGSDCTTQTTALVKEPWIQVASATELVGEISSIKYGGTV